MRAFKHNSQLFNITRFHLQTPNEHEGRGERKIPALKDIILQQGREQQALIWGDWLGRQLCSEIYFHFRSPAAILNLIAWKTTRISFSNTNPKPYQQRNNSYVQETNLSEAYHQRNNYYVQETNLRCWNGLKGSKKAKWWREVWLSSVHQTGVWCFGKRRSFKLIY